MTFSAKNLTGFRSTVFVGLGSNLNDPVCQVHNAIREIDEIPEVSLAAISSFYQTAPVGIIDQPPFVNAVVCVHTTLSPHDFLRHLAAIEVSHGRVRGEKNGPRTLDLDILIFNEWRINDAKLITPHPRMHERPFVLIPLLEIAPEVYIPGKGAAAKALAMLDAGGVQKMVTQVPIGK
jgi:2-amino-4-hydroxy-6-hydroxymethyldihydropteridine diphosphokinase